ncbi:hypothetical protein Godav_004381, partial [Gossypium davidsonii]|nr:hypothetical protein [Gossypium davidsonii]
MTNVDGGESPSRLEVCAFSSCSLELSMELR